MYSEKLWLTRKNYDKLIKSTIESNVKVKFISSTMNWIDCEVICEKPSQLIILLLENLR